MRAQSVAINALLGGKHGSSSSNSNSGFGSSPLGALAQQIIGGGGHGNSSSGGHSGKPSSSNLVGTFAQSILSGHKPSNGHQTSTPNYHQGQSSQGQGSHGGGLAGNIVGAIFGGGKLNTV